MPQLWAFGGGALDEASDAPAYETVMLNSDGAKAALRASYDVYVRDKSVPVSALTNTQTENQNPFIAGQLAMMIAHPSEYAKMVDLQQYDSPKNVFDNPRNTFVASFVGSPAMSLVPLEATSKGGQVHLGSPDGWSFPLNEKNSRKARGATTSKIVLGARHSTINLHKSASPGAVPGKVYTVEPTGDVTFAQVFLGSAVVIVSVEPQVTLTPDEPVWLEFDQDRIHLFDGETQLALTAN